MSATELTQEAIKAAILQYLPAHVGDVLQSELLALKEVRAVHANTKSLLDTEARKGKEMAVELNAMHARVKIADEILAREAAVLIRENKQDMRELEVKLADLRRQDAVDMVKLVFRSPVFTRAVSGSVPIAVDGMPSNQYGGGSPGAVVTSYTSTTETSSQG